MKKLTPRRALKSAASRPSRATLLHRVVFAVAAFSLLLGVAWGAVWYWNDNVSTSHWIVAQAWPSMTRAKTDGNGWLTGAAALLLQQYAVDFMVHYEVEGVSYSRTSHLCRFLVWRATHLKSEHLPIGRPVLIKYDPQNPANAMLVYPENEPWYGFWLTCILAMAVSGSYLARERKGLIV